jgi:tRNA(Ile)-lysidine synthase
VNKSASAAESGAAISDFEAAGLFASFPHSGHVVLAVSGGADSTALLVLAARWRVARPDGSALSAATVDHGLRPQSRTEAHQAAALARKLGIPHHVLTWEGEKPATGIEVAARNARRRLLAAHARSVGASDVATAHTLDDQAETVLMRLAAGSGPAGLVGMQMQERRDGLRWRRPFLTTRKQRLIATLQRHGIPWSEDPMNWDARFERPRLRAAADVLAREGLTPERLARLAERMARYEAVVAGCTEAAASAVGSDQAGSLDGGALLALPEELALRLLAGEVTRVTAGETEGLDHPIRLQRLESLWRDLRVALAAGESLRRTLAGALVSVGRDRVITITREPTRRRGTSSKPACHSPHKGSPSLE